MKKQAKNQIFKSVLLLLSVVLLIAGAVTVAVATTPASLYHTLVIDFDSANVETCIITYVKDNKGTIETKEVTDGEEFTILDGVSVSITVTPKAGMWPKFEFGDNAHTASVAGNVIKWQEFIADNTVSITCENRTYTIHALDLDGVTDIKNKAPGDDPIPYNYVVVAGERWTFEDLTEGAVKYTSGSEDLTELPMVSSGNQIFKGWYIKTSKDSASPIEPDAETGKYYMPKTLTMMTDYMYEQDGIIYVFPKFVPQSYSVYREDWVHKETGEDHGKIQLFSSKREEFGGSQCSALELNYWPDDPLDGYKSYKGYLLHTSCEHSKCDGAPITVYDSTKEEYRNTVYRYYTPILYTLKYEDVAVDFDGPATYSYSNPTTVKNPSRLGYNFKGWEIKVYNAAEDKWDVYVWDVPANQPEKTFILGNEYAYYDEETSTWNDPNAIYASDAQADGSYEIQLKARWEAIKYPITYQWGNGVTADLIQNALDLNENYGTFEFDKVSFIPNPVRAGYTFAGWVMTYTLDGSTPAVNGLTAVEGGYTIDGSLHAQEITLTALWQVETYTVVLDGQGATNEFTTSISGVQYDAALVVPEGFVIPTKKGYTFVGYYNQAGTKKYINADGTSVEGLWDLDGENGTVTLYAKWEINYYNVIIEPIQKVPAGVTITIVETASGTRHPYTGEAVSLPYQTEFKVEIVMPDGFKIVMWNDVDVTPHSGNLFVSDPIQLDAEDMTLTATACPAAPSIGVGENVESIIVESDTSIKVNFANESVADDYEVAISTNRNDAELVWNQVASENAYYLFTDLNPGTTYYVFIRLEQTENTNSGIPTVKEELTRYDAYVNETIANLNGLFTTGDGNITKAVIQDTVNKIEALRNTDPLPADFYEQIEALVAEIEAKLVFARLQDAKIAELESFLDDCFRSGSFSEANKQVLKNLCTAAVADISVATTPEGVETVCSTAKAAMQAVPVTYLYDVSGTMQLTTLLGLDQSSGITLRSIEDIKALRRAVADAIAQGKITADSFITIEQAQELLRTLDTVSAYNFYLTNVQPVDGDTFVFRLTIPEALVGRTGLQVAYYNAATGMVELLETTVEGNTLVFRANQVADFVILADPTVDLTGVIIALGVIVLCQLIAIAFVLAARNKAKNAVLHASVALPMFLTIHFLPDNAELIVLALGVVALVLQIVLMWLLISSGMIRVFKTKRSASETREITAVVREEDMQENPTAVFDEDDQIADEESANDAEPAVESVQEEQNDEALNEDAFDEELAEELAREQQEEIFDEEGETIDEELLAAEIEEVYDDEEFIEHATESYYSLDDEEDVYADIQEETERVSDVDTADTETEETPYGEGSFDRVFGGAYLQDSDSGDEGGSSSYEDSYGESYEYGEETDASYAETEIADREETSGEGSVDATSYIVNDEEELSEEEEMYRYDE